MSGVVARLKPELVFSPQAKAALVGRPRNERRQIAHAIRRHSQPLLRLYQFARRQLPTPLAEPGFQRWILVKLENFIAVVNLFGTQIQVRLILHKDERERWAYVQCLLSILRSSERANVTRIVEITLRPPEFLVGVVVFLFRGRQFRHRYIHLPNKKVHGRSASAPS